jgi:hypothetical protein
MTIPVFKVTFISPVQGDNNVSSITAYGEQALDILTNLYPNYRINPELIGYKTSHGFVPKKTI